MNADKVRENRLRRMAERQGFTLNRSRTRDKRALNYGVYYLILNGADRVPPGGENGLSLDEVEKFLTSDPNA